jgi:hypothetical protein
MFLSLLAHWQLELEQLFIILKLLVTLPLRMMIRIVSDISLHARSNSALRDFFLFPIIR